MPADVLARNGNSAEYKVRQVFYPVPWAKLSTFRSPDDVIQNGGRDLEKSRGTLSINKSSRHLWKRKALPLTEFLTSSVLYAAFVNSCISPIWPGLQVDFTWWRHQMETFSTLLALCAWNSPVIGEFPSQRPVTRSFDVFFDLRLNKRLSKQSWGWWFETPSRLLWRHCNV